MVNYNIIYAWVVYIIAVDLVWSQISLSDGDEDDDVDDTVGSAGRSIQEV